MANSAKIQSIAQGQFFVKDSLGNLVELKVGDTVSLNDTIVAINSNTDLSKIEILFDTNELIILSQGETLLDETLLASTFGNEELAFDKKEIDETLNAWNNIDGESPDMETAAGDVTEQATNAGNEEAKDGGALRSKFNSRDGSETDVISDLQEQFESDINDIIIQNGDIVTSLLNPLNTDIVPITPTPVGPIDSRVPSSKITLNNSTVYEGQDITITAIVDNAPQTDLKITLSNGKEITIPAGQTSGSTTFTNPNGEDVYKDGSTETYTIIDTAGGNYISLDKSDSSVVTIIDTIDVTTVTITGTDTIEGGKATFELELSNKPQTGSTATGKVEVDGKSYDVTFDADGKATLTVDVKENDVYKGEPTITAKVIEVNGGNFEGTSVVGAETTITVKDVEDPVDVTITATATTPKIIDVNTKLDGTTGVKITGINSDGKETALSVIKGTDHDGFGVETKDKNGNNINLSNGDTKELGFGEKIVVEFTGGKDVNSLDVSFAWRNNHETAKLTFVKDGKIVGYATVSGDGSSTTKAFVKYYDENNKLIKEVNAKGSSDKVDEAFTFELPDSNGGIVSFDKVEFTAPTNVDDYLINKIVYKEVIDPTVTDIEIDGGNVTFNIQIDEKYPPQGKATATVEVNGKTYQVELNATGRGTLTIDSKDLGDLSKVIAKVTKVDGGNYEKVNPTTGKFDFTSTIEVPTSSNDNISTNEDNPLTLKVTDFGDVSVNTKEFKITQLPENGKLYVVITKGETIFNKDGSQTVATEDSKVEVSKGQVISLAQVGAGQVVFEPKGNYSGRDDSFKFQVGDGKGNFSSEYTITIDVKAVADAPTVSISITPDTNNPTSTGSNGNGNSGSTENNGSSNIGATKPSLNISSDWWNGLTELTKNDVIQDTPTYQVETVDWSNKPNFTNGNDIVNIGTLTSSSNGINTGSGDDSIYISKDIENNGSNIDSGDGNDKVLLVGNVGSSVNLGAGDDKLDIKGNFTGARIDAGTGNDEIFIKGNASQSSTINLGEGNNKLHAKKDIGNLIGHSGDDTILVEGNTTNTVNLGAGNNELHIKGNAGDTITTGSGNDKVFIEKDAKNSINLGDGDNLLHIKGNAENAIDTGSGNDKVFIEKDAKNSIRLGAGNNELYIKGNAENTIDTGAGNDIVIVDGNAKNSVRLGDGNNELYIKGSAVDITTGIGDDKVFVDGNISNYVNLGSGDDYLEIGGKLTANNVYLDGGDGQDALYLKDYTKQQYESDFVANYQSWRIKNFETITFKDGDTYKIDKDGNLGDKVEAKGYKYDITVNAKLTDIDGSEKLSDVTIKNIPEGTTLYNGEVNEANKLTANSDGSYTVKVDASGNAKLSLTNEKELSDTDLNSIKASATSNEVNEKGEITDSATTTATKDTISFNGSGDIDLSNLKNISEINLDNGKENKISLTLDDVLKISGDDNKIKISGDMFDSVALKNESGKDWTKSQSPITEDNKTFDVYTNSGDSTVQVKVEQPISDGITN